MAIQVLKYPLWLAGFILMTGCEQWADGVIREIAFPERAPELSATVVLASGDASAVACLYQTASTLDSVGSTIPEGVSAQMLYNGSVVLEWAPGDIALVGESWNNQMMHVLPLALPLDLSPGNYELVVEAPGFDALTAAAIQPPIPEADVAYREGVDTVLEGGYYEWLKVIDALDIDLVNRPGIQDVYGLSIQEAYVYSPGDTTWNLANIDEDGFGLDPRLNFNDACLCWLVDDQGLDGQSLEGFTLERPRYESPYGYGEDDPGPLRVTVSLLDPALGEFYRSIDRRNNADGNPFANPSTVFSNTSTGYGCFGLASREVFLFD